MAYKTILEQLREKSGKSSFKPNNGGLTPFETNVNYLMGGEPTDLSDYYTKEVVDNKLTSLEEEMASLMDEKIAELPTDNFLNNAKYDSESHILTLTMKSEDTVEVNLEDLVDEYNDDEIWEAVNTINNILDGIGERLDEFDTKFGQVEESLGGKADKDDVYTKDKVDEKFGEIDFPEIDLSEYYTKNETNDILDDKVDNDRVLTDVPENAVFTDTVYDDADIKADIAKKADKDNVVMWVKENDDKHKLITLENHQNLLGRTTSTPADKGEELDNKGNPYTDGTVNLAMLSKWNVADFGSPTVKINLNGKEERPTYNDDKEIALLDDVNALETKVNDHVNNEDIHVTSDDKANWDNKGTSNLELGETEETAYRGDFGKVAYEHSQEEHAPVDAQKNVQSDWDEEDVESDSYIVNKPEIPSLDGFATEEWVEEQRFLTEHQDISGKADKDDVVMWETTSNTEKNRLIILNNHQNLLGRTTSKPAEDGEEFDNNEKPYTNGAVNLAMLSKWNVADFGSATVKINLNGKEERPTYNDKKEIALMDDVNDHVDNEDIHVTSEDKANWDNKQDKLTAGTNITISGTTISATDTIYDDSAVKADIAKKADKEYVDGRFDNLPEENFLKNAEYNSETAILTLTMESDDVFEVDLKDLIDVYDDAPIKADIALKADKATTYNKDEVDNLIDGIEVDLSNYYDKSEVDGLIPSISDLATKTELSEKADKDELIDKADKTELETEIQARESADTTLDGKINTVNDTLDLKADISYVDEQLSGKANQQFVVEELDNKANTVDVYTKDEVDEKFGEIEFPETDLSEYYTKDETNDILGGKVNNDRVLTDVPENAVFTDTVYDDTAVKADIALKADKVDTYTKTEVDTKLNTKVDNDRVLTAVPANAKFTDTVYDDTAIKTDIAKKADKVDTYTKDEVDNKFNVKFSSGITDIVFVDVLPDENDREDNVLYLVKED